jgi:uncharacterized protein YkwD
MSNLERKHVRLIGLKSLGAALSLSLVASLGIAGRAAHVQPRSKMKPVLSTGFSFHRSEKCVMRRINRIRRRHGLRALERDPQVGYISRLHAITMARAGSIFHDDNFGNEVTNWYRLGQNTGSGRSCHSVVRAFMHDPAHKAIILGPWRFQGVGIHSSGRTLYVQHIFESRANPGNVYSIP